MPKTETASPIPSTIVIAGRTFHGVTQELSAAQDHYLIGQLRLADCLKFMAVEDPEAATEGLLTQMLVSGRVGQILAGCLTEEGQTWSREEAERNAGLFDAVTDPESKMAMRNALLGFALGFFQYATASVAISQKSSSPS